jgi:hypothetical protein
LVTYGFGYSDVARAACEQGLQDWISVGLPSLFTFSPEKYQRCHPSQVKLPIDKASVNKRALSEAEWHSFFLFHLYKVLSYRDLSSAYHSVSRFSVLFNHLEKRKTWRKMLFIFPKKKFRKFYLPVNI